MDRTRIAIIQSSTDGGTTWQQIDSCSIGGNAFTQINIIRVISIPQANTLSRKGLHTYITDSLVEVVLVVCLFKNRLIVSSQIEKRVTEYLIEHDICVSFSEKQEMSHQTAIVLKV